MFRVLKKGGWALLNVPIDISREKTFEDPSITEPKQREEIFGQSDHVRVYGMDYINRLQEAGFTVDVIDFTANFSSAEQFKYGLQKGELIFYCEKK